MALAGAALVGAESVLALTPIAIKKTRLHPIDAIWSRVLSSAAIGYGVTSDRSLPPVERGPAAALGYANLLHVASSYEAFRNLPAGAAMALLYTYPLWNLVFGALFGGEKIDREEWAGIGVAAVGSALLSSDVGGAVEAAVGGKPRWGWGVAMGLLMAITESAMHTLLKGLKWMDAAKSVWVVNSSASLWLGLAVVVQWFLGDGKVAATQISGAATWIDAFWLTAFHAITMFSGYWLRFFAVPRLTTVSYSILSYAGLFASYMFGLLFLGERPGWWSLLGAVLIVAGGAVIQIAGGGVTEMEGKEEEVAGVGAGQD
jgi:drug/metabolite transporter (DMT)-like permease